MKFAIGSPKYPKYSDIIIPARLMMKIARRVRLSDIAIKTKRLKAKRL